jgi:hypothetical protein
VYTVGWRFLDGPPDPWTQRLYGFKNGEWKYVRAGGNLLKLAVSDVIALHNLDPGVTLLATALSHNATEADPKSSLYRVGQWIADELKLKWAPAAFTKTAHRSLRTLGSGIARDAEVANRYRCKILPNVKTIIVLDDFVTRGATLADMRRAAIDKNGALGFIGVALGKNERPCKVKEFYGMAINNDHITEEMDRLWNEKYRNA